MSIDYNEEKEKDEFPRQCYGPGCTNAARSGSKYCSDECGIHLVVISIRSLRKHNNDMENVSPKYIFTLSDISFSLTLCNMDKAFCQGIPTNCFEVKMESQHLLLWVCVVVESAILFLSRCGFPESVKQSY